ncbi:MAG: L-carnitine dehydrogenase [Rhodospirillales bacterium]|nr:L-carnitine dehydrogenase [Rhodospirillales bacterium]MDH3910345.1 L-carnitine dehydrogenase [Rhodospirillales bacterium]
MTMAEAAAAEVRKVAVIGTGVIGAGWAARCLGHGLDVAAWDPGPDAEAKLRAAVDNAWPAVAKLGLWPGADPARLSFAATPEDACAGADFVQESAPEREDLKRRLLAQLDAAAPEQVVIASSSSGLLPSRIQADCRHPGRVVIGHPFNPVYLLPLVEVLGGALSDPQAVARAMAFYRSLGMHALEVRNEIDGYISDRLQEAVWREILHLVNDGVASTDEIDDAISYGPGLRWAIMGTCLTFHLAGGEGGLRHMLEQFGPALKLPWTKLVAPELNDTLIERMVEGTRRQAAGRSIQELERLRDDCLIAIMQALRGHDVGAGQTLAADEARRLGGQAFARWEMGAEVPAPLALYSCTVLPEWVDYNGHMSEACFLTAFGWASDALFRYVGIDEAYRAAGHSFYTVESHINFLREASTGEPLSFTTQLLGLDEKRLHFFHAMFHGRTGALLATTEQMLLHVDMNAAKTAPIAPEVHEALAAVWAVHRDLPAPEQAGRRMSVGPQS